MFAPIPNGIEEQFKHSLEDFPKIPPLQALQYFTSV